MSIVKGVVERVSSKEFNGKLVWSIKVGGKFYGSGFNQPKCREGETVEFDTVQKGNYLNVDGPINVVAASSPSTTVTTGAPMRPTEDLRQKAITYQASRNAGIEVVKVLVQAGALKLPTKQADQVDVVLALVDELTDKYNKDTNDIVSFGQRRGNVVAEENTAEQNPDF